MSNLGKRDHPAGVPLPTTSLLSFSSVLHNVGIPLDLSTVLVISFTQVQVLKMKVVVVGCFFLKILKLHIECFYHFPIQYLAYNNCGLTGGKHPTESALNYQIISLSQIKSFIATEEMQFTRTLNQAQFFITSQHLLLFLFGMQSNALLQVEFLIHWSAMAPTNTCLVTNSSSGE